MKVLIIQTRCQHFTKKQEGASIAFTKHANMYLSSNTTSRNVTVQRLFAWHFAWLSSHYIPSVPLIDDNERWFLQMGWFPHLQIFIELSWIPWSHWFKKMISSELQNSLSFVYRFDFLISHELHPMQSINHLRTGQGLLRCLRRRSAIPWSWTSIAWCFTKLWRLLGKHMKPLFFVNSL